MNSAHSSHWKSVFPVAILGAAFVITSAPTLHGEQGRPRVFITDSQSWEVTGSAAGSGGTFASRTQGGARPQTAEIIKTFVPAFPALHGTSCFTGNHRWVLSHILKPSHKTAEIRKATQTGNR